MAGGRPGRATAAAAACGSGCGIAVMGVVRAGVAWDAQMAAGSPGPVQAGGPDQPPGSLDGDAAGLPEQLPHEDLLVVDGPQGPAAARQAARRRLRRGVGCAG